MLMFKGRFNPTTKTPELRNSSGYPGNMFYVEEDGAHDFGFGEVELKEGDYVVYTGWSWELFIMVGNEPIAVENETTSIHR